ncbi:Phage major tail protein 2 [Labrenzia sp. THAF82]|uniref:phage tail tube protein n=1 Tax=Labrenzia sp. THAF82 TaxID=2587861 RepID=UPI001269620C|nr:phage tail tube protein [Labrenzia sp. THAF82]QFT31814.1 Phage major tail protein 2 [Labrenzia sp. THAF82]
MASKGRLLLLKIGDGATPTEAFTNGCGFRARNFTINNNIVDTTTPDCASPGNTVTYSGDYGIQTVTFSGSGESSEDVQNLLLMNATRQQSAQNIQVVVPGWGMFEGAALIGSFEFSGEVEGTMEFSCEITMTGAITFTAET